VADLKFMGIPVVTSKFLPSYPTPAMDARTIVRTGLKKWVQYIGEEPPKHPPGTPAHAFIANNEILISHELYEKFKDRYIEEELKAWLHKTSSR
jgi:hypothetical protein